MPHLDEGALYARQFDQDDVVQQQVHEEVVAHEAVQRLPVRPLEQRDQRVWVVAHDAVGLGHKVARGSRRGVAVAERQQVPVFPVRPPSPEKALPSPAVQCQLRGLR